LCQASNGTACVQGLLGIAGDQSQPPNLRMFAALLLRKLVSMGSKVWKGMAAGAREATKAALLSAIQAEPEAMVRRQLANAIAFLASHARRDSAEDFCRLKSWSSAQPWT